MLLGLTNFTEANLGSGEEMTLLYEVTKEPQEFAGFLLLV